jgi:redox-sensitive bicupin YhaK (pirin superfamily)
VDLNGQKLNQGDGAAVTDESQLSIRGVENAEVLLFDLA